MLVMFTFQMIELSWFRLPPAFMALLCTPIALVSFGMLIWHVTALL
jgi:hypothetical protein